jgi:DNA/RNA-binding domain of Phe-tRNA-synthetase-like protein
MENLKINTNVYNIFSELHLGVVVCKNISNIKSIEANNLLNNTILSTKERILDLTNLTDLEVIKDWRNAYKKFNEKKNRSSIESLLRRIYNNKPVTSINPLVDIYNSISLKYNLPCGGEDIDKITNDMELTISNGMESFLPLGSDMLESPNLNEIIYKSDDMVICRCFNWRESEITKLTSNTKNAILCIECLHNDDVKNLKLAIDDLTNCVIHMLGGECKSYILNKENTVINVAK